MSAITLGAIQAKQAELAAMIQQLAGTSQPAQIQIEATSITLQPGERYAGAVLDEAGQHQHHLVLLAAVPDGNVDWKNAMAWAKSVGGVLPTRQEQALLYANCKPHLAATWHWSSETYEGDASYAWGCRFYYGTQYDGLKSYEGSAVAVRRV